MATAISSLLAFLPDAAQRIILGAVDPGPGLVAHICASEVEADRIVARIQPDVVLGGRGSGVAWLAQIRNRDPDVFRIMWLDKGPHSVAFDAINRGDADAVLREPFTADEISELFRHGCEEALLRRHTRSLVDELAVRNAELLGFNERLEELVAERTRHLVEAQERLQESNRQMLQLETQSTVTHLLRGLAHEFNNPLAAIYGYAQRLRRQATDNDLARRLDVILQEVEHCRRVVQQLNQLSTPMSEQPVPLDPVQALRDGAARCAAGGLVVPHLDLDALPPQVIAAPRALARVFEQVVANAVDAGAATIALHGVTLGDRVRLLVVNDGETPDEQTITNAVRPFFTTRAREDRRGLGLASAAALLREQDGTIELNRREDGTGATVVIQLPAADPVVRHASSHLLPIVSAGLSGGPPLVPTTLVIDDEPMVAEILVDALREAGCATATAGSVAEGLAELTRLDVHALVVDLHLPDGSGLDLARRALALRPALAGHIALTTGDNGRATIESLVAEHGFPVLAKPFRIEEVRELAKRIA